ncbi:MAG: prolipoprotein diacylglyceryl transferase [Cytophagales bacterium]
MFSFIIWNASPEIFELGNFAIRWYGLGFAIAFLLGQQIMYKIYAWEGKSKIEVDNLTVWMVSATVIGARLGHCLFYEPDIYLKDPIRILKIWEGGLASHGAAIAILGGIWIYSRKFKNQGFLWLLDRLVITIALAGAFIRLGNLMNSEIIGKPTQSESGFVFVRSVQDNIFNYFDRAQQLLPRPKKISFEKSSAKIEESEYMPLSLKLHFNKNSADEKKLEEIGEKLIPHILEGFDEDDHNHVEALKGFKPLVYDDGKYQVLEIVVGGVPRHPSQLYESISCILLMLLLGAIYLKLKENTPNGLLLGLFMTVCFGLRFLWEYLKENQVAFEDELAFNMGQILSIPLVLAGLGLVIYSLLKNKKQG